MPLAKKPQPRSRATRATRAASSRAPLVAAALLTLTLASLLAPRVAHAQGAQDTRARELLRDAADALQSLDVDRAEHRARDAIRRCGARNCSPRATAEAYATLGIVLLSGRQDADGAAAAFATAAQHDPAVELNPLIASPEARAALRRAARALRGTQAAALVHTPVVEQSLNTPVPVYVETGIAGAVHVDLFYRVAGAPSFAQVRMERIGRGWGAEVPCSAVTGDAAEYYVSAFDEHDQVYAEAGNEDEPLRVALVQHRTRAEAFLPGRLPPERCAAGGADRRAMGGACTSANDCERGLACDRGVCAAPRPQAPGFQHFAADLGLGLGLGFLGGTPGYAEAVPIDPSQPNGPAMCMTVSCPATPGGVGAMGYLALNVRYAIIPLVAVAGSMRWQPDAASRTTLSGLLFSLRGYVAVTPEGFARRRGFIASVFAGTGVGQIEPRPPTPSQERPDAATGHIVTGLNNVHFGARVEYDIGPMLFGAESTAQFQFPRFLFDLDLQLLAGVRL